MPARKLTDDQAAEARRLHGSTANLPRALRRDVISNPERWTYDRLAKHFGVSVRTIEKAVRGEGTYATATEGSGSDAD